MRRGNTSSGDKKIARPLRNQRAVRDGIVLPVPEVIVTRTAPLRVVNIDVVVPFTEVSYEKLASLATVGGGPFDSAFYEKTAGVIGGYISALCAAEGIRKPSAEKSGGWIVREMREYTEHRYFEHLSLHSLARRYFMNEKYLGRLFARECGMRYATYLNLVRIEEAKRALSSGGESVLDIALSCGYESVTYFNRRFREAERISPTEYRKQAEKHGI